MKVNFYATLRQIAGQKTVEIDLTEQTDIHGLLDAIVRRYPDMRRELLDDQGKLYPHVHVFVNGRDAPFLDDGLETRLDKEDKIDVFPAVGGG